MIEATLNVSFITYSKYIDDAFLVWNREQRNQWCSKMIVKYISGYALGTFASLNKLLTTRQITWNCLSLLKASVYWSLCLGLFISHCIVTTETTIIIKKFVQYPK